MFAVLFGINDPEFPGHICHLSLNMWFSQVASLGPHVMFTFQPAELEGRKGRPQKSHAPFPLIDRWPRLVKGPHLIVREAGKFSFFSPKPRAHVGLWLVKEQRLNIGDKLEISAHIGTN